MTWKYCRNVLKNWSKFLEFLSFLSTTAFGAFCGICSNIYYLLGEVKFSSFWSFCVLLLLCKMDMNVFCIYCVVTVDHVLLVIVVVSLQLTLNWVDAHYSFADVKHKGWCRRDELPLISVLKVNHGHVHVIPMR